MKQLIFALVILCFVCCRKKDERYEGNYVGTERHTYRDSGATSNSLDTTYAEEVQVTYSNALRGRRKLYDFTKVGDSQNPWSISKKSIVDHEYTDGYSGGYLKFSGDSLYIYRTNFSDNVENWDWEVWEFKGKRM